MTQLFMPEKICVFSRKFQKRESRKHFASPGILQFFHKNIKQKNTRDQRKASKRYIYFISNIFLILHDFLGPVKKGLWLSSSKLNVALDSQQYVVT